MVPAWNQVQKNILKLEWFNHPETHMKLDFPSKQSMISKVTVFPLSANSLVSTWHWWSFRGSQHMAHTQTNHQGSQHGLTAPEYLPRFRHKRLRFNLKLQFELTGYNTVSYLKEIWPEGTQQKSTSTFNSKTHTQIQTPQSPLTKQKTHKQKHTSGIFGWHVCYIFSNDSLLLCRFVLPKLP